MKKQALLFLIILSSILTAMGQAPVGFNYQAVIRDADGLVLNNQEVGMQISIIQGSPTDNAVYSETFSAETNNHGIVNLVIGSGNVQSGTFGDIDWSLGDYYIKIEVDVAGGTNYTEMGTTQLLSVPYAHYAFSGNAGKSAYEVWLELGNTGTEDDFIASLTGPNGESAYEVWLGLGNTGTEQDFIDAITGDSGTSSWTDEETAVHTTKNVGIGTSTPTAPLQIESTTKKEKGEPIFEVKNSEGKTVFAVYENDVKVFLETDETTGTPGEFAVKRRTTDTQIDDIFVANTEETTIFVDSTTSTSKETRGGFAISGRTSGKEDLDFFKVTPGLTEVFVDEATATKETRGGFAISGRTSGKITSDIFHVTNEFTRLYVDEPTAKDTRGGFAISGRTSGKAEQEFLKITPGLTEFFVDETSTAKDTRGGFAISGRTSGKTTSEIFRLTNDYTRFYVDETTTTKDTRGGFAISGRTSGKAVDQDILKVTPGLTEVFVEETAGKDTRGGFAISGRTSGKSDGLYDVLTVKPERTEIYVKDDPTKSIIPGFSIFGMDNQFNTGELFTVTEQGATVNGSMAVAPDVTTAAIESITQTTAMGGGQVTDSSGSTIIEVGIIYNKSGILNTGISTVDPSVSGIITGDPINAADFSGLTINYLDAGTTYQVRAYAMNADGATGYGDVVTFTTEPPYNVSFDVTDTQGSPISNATITVTEQILPFSSITNAEGNYDFQLAAGEYEVQVVAYGYYTYTDYPTISTEGQTINISMSEAPAQLTMNMIDDLGNPVPNAYVNFTHEISGSESTESDTTGVAKVYLDAGKWYYNIYPSTPHEEYYDSVIMETDIDQTIDVTIPALPTYTIDVMVYMPDSTTAAVGASVQLMQGWKEGVKPNKDNSKEYMQTVTTNEFGIATFTDVPEGDFYSINVNFGQFFGDKYDLTINQAETFTIYLGGVKNKK